MYNKKRDGKTVVVKPSPVKSPRSVECPVGGYNPDWTSGRD